MQINAEKDKSSGTQLGQGGGELFGVQEMRM